MRRRVARPAARIVKLLVVVAHPDDEAFGCGSILAHATKHGVASTVLCATRGELGEIAPTSDATQAQLGKVREAELRHACDVLGVDRVELLDWIDSGMIGAPASGSLVAADHEEVVDAIVAVIERLRPDVVVTLDASDGHRDHVVMRDATLAAIRRARHQPQRTYLSCLVRSLLGPFTGDPDLGTPDDEITTVVDVSDLLDQRWRAIRAHASQVPPFDAMSPEMQAGFLAVDHMCQVLPQRSVREPEHDWIPSANL